MKLAPYPAYKDSGDDWLGQVPNHWSVKPIKSVAMIDSCGSYGEEESSLDIDLPVATTAQIDQDGNFDVEKMPVRSFSYKDVIRYGCNDGDILIVKSSGSATNIISGKAGIVDTHTPKFIFSNFLLRIIPDSKIVNNRLIYSILISNLTRERIKCMVSSTTYPNLKVDEYTSALIALPPLSEQEAIAAYLDAETAKIDALVAEQRQLVEVLKEKRQALISHTVTKGLDPSAPLKDSGIEWLGRVPEHWKVEPVMYHYHVQLGKMLDSSKITGDHLRPYLRVFDVQWGVISTEDLPMMDFDENARLKFRLKRGDILVNEGGSYPGRSAIWEEQIEECYYQKALHRLRVLDHKKDISKYFYYTMIFAFNQGVFVAGGNETTIEHLPAEKIKKYRFSFPPLLEQEAIAAYLDAATAKIDALIREAEEMVERMLEHRSSLISHVVTGKVRVEGVQ